LRIGASATACQYVLPTVLRQFKESFPRCSIIVEPGDTRKAVELLRNHRVDLAVTLEPKNEEQLDFQPLFTDELSFLVAPVHSWAKEGQVKRADIPRQNYVLYDKGSYTFRLIEEYFREEDMVLNTVIELGSMEAIKELVKLGLGVSILAPWIVQKELQEGSLVCLPLGKRKLKRNWGLLHWRSRRLSLAEETFLNLCRTATRDLGKSSCSQAA
jgi:DNA-binding transcriptional LysR family regulator